MANRADALLIVASLLVAAASVAGARVVTVQRHVTVGRNYAVLDAKPVPALVCNKVHAVVEDETCFSIAGSAGLTEEQFLGFNPNINCAMVFLGQWVCLDAVAGA